MFISKDKGLRKLKIKINNTIIKNKKITKNIEKNNLEKTKKQERSKN